MKWFEGLKMWEELKWNVILSGYLEGSFSLRKLLVDWVELRRAFWPSCQRQGCLHRRPWPWLKKKVVYLRKILRLPTSISAFGCHLSASLGRYQHDFFFFLIENPFEMQKIEEGRGFESDLWKTHSVRSVSTCKLFWHNSQQAIVVNNFL